MKRAGNAIPGRSSGRPGQPRNRGDGGQLPGLITERDERMRCLYATASPDRIGMPDLMRYPRRSPRTHNTQITDRIIASAGVQLGGGHLEVHAGAGSTYRSGGCLAPTMGCHAGEPDEP